MNYSVIRKILGKIMISIGFLMSLSLIFCVVYKENLINYISFIVPVVLLVGIGFLMNIKRVSVLYLYYFNFACDRNTACYAFKKQ